MATTKKNQAATPKQDNTQRNISLHKIATDIVEDRTVAYLCVSADKDGTALTVEGGDPTILYKILSRIQKHILGVIFQQTGDVPPEVIALMGQDIMSRTPEVREGGKEKFMEKMMELQPEMKPLFEQVWEELLKWKKPEKA